ncbi:MAG TPA: ABC transporter ATP-binding protein [Actinomycetales bacterium]|nr:ABC transporter ATP-binding protein [Actinomycetales bacterium]
MRENQASPAGVAAPGPRPPQLAVQLTDLTKTFNPRGADPVRAVDGVSLTIQTGEVVALLGPNGAGKTTALDILLGLQDPSSGTAQLFGGPPQHAIRAGRVAAVLQTGDLLRDLRVRETVELIASTFGRTIPVDEALARVDIDYAARRRVSKLSGGEQQRVRFALALLPDPDLLVLDEPTAGLDVTTRRAFWSTMRAEAAHGRTILFATHYLEEAEQFAQRVVMMSGGRVVADGPTAEIRSVTSSRRMAVTRADDVAWASSLPGTSQLASDPANGGVRVSLTAADSDAVALALLERGGSALEIDAPSLEDAFVALTDGRATVGSGAGTTARSAVGTQGRVGTTRATTAPFAARATGDWKN